MAISFTLNLSPAQIEFLQHLDLYAKSVHKSILQMPRTRAWTHFVSSVGKLIREGLVIHVDNQKSSKDDKTIEDHRYYQITPKGQSVLALIDDDIRAFIGRQNEIQRLRKKAV